MKRLKTIGRVDVAGCIAKECFETSGRVAEAGSKIKESVLAFSRVASSVASVWRWTDALSTR